MNNDDYEWALIAYPAIAALAIFGMWLFDPESVELLWESITSVPESFRWILGAIITR